MKLDSHIREWLQRCSKDDISLSRLETLFSEIVSKYEEARNQLRMLEKAISHDYDSILITDLGLDEPGPRIVYVNDGFTRMTGYTKEEVIGKTPRILQGPKTERTVLDRLKKGLADGQGFFGHTINYRKDGSEFIAQWDIHPLLNEDGEVTHWVSYQRDVTERESINRRIMESSLEFEVMDEDLKGTLLEIDENGNIIDSNHSFRETVGYDSEELTQLKLWDIVAEEHQAAAKEIGEKALDTARKKATYTWDFKTKEGGTVNLKANFKLSDVDGKTQIKLCFENQSLRNKLIEALKAKTLSLEETLHKQNEFTLKFRQKDGEPVCYYASESFEPITGYKNSEIYEEGINLILKEKRVSVFHKHLKKAFEGKTTTVECACIKKDGRIMPIIQAFRPIWNDSKTKVEAVKTVALLEMQESSGGESFNTPE